jgi:outer membrane protein assembly factor BamB
MALLAAAVIIAVLLGTPLLLSRPWLLSTGDYNHTNNTPGGLPTLTLSPNVTYTGTTIQLSIKNFTPSTRVALTHDSQIPIHIDGGSSIITVGPAGSANVDVTIDSSWGTGFHLIVAEDLKTRYTASTTLLITGSATQAYASFVATNGIMYGFDAQHTHFNPFEHILNPTTVGGLTKKWAYDMSSSVISSPTVAGGVVYIGCVCGYMYALDAATGTKKWAYSTGGSQVGDDPAVVGGVVYFGSVESHTLYALDAATGAKKWTYQTRGTILSSPTVVGGVVYVGSDDNTLYALDAVTGAKKWAYWTRGSIESSPAVAGGMVYVGSFDGNVYAFDAATGAKKWAYRTGNNVYNSPAVSGGVVYVGAGDGNVYAFDATTGVKKWVYRTGGPLGPSVSSPAVSGGIVYVGSRGDGNVYALDATTGAKKWIFPIKVDTSEWGGRCPIPPLLARPLEHTPLSKGTLLPPPIPKCLNSFMSTDPVLASGLVYFGSGDGILYALDAASGAKKWAYRDGSTIDSSPAVADGVVYYGSLSSPLYAFHLPGT